MAGGTAGRGGYACRSERVPRARQGRLCGRLVWDRRRLASHGQPFLPGLERGREPLSPGSVAFLAVFRRPVSPGAVSELVIVHGRDYRMRRVERLHIGIAPVLRVARPVVRQCPAFVRWIERPADVLADCLAGWRCLRSFVDVVTQVKHEVEIMALGYSLVSVEVAGAELCARDLGKAQAAATGPRQGFRGADWRPLVMRFEPVRVARGGAEARHISGDCPVSTGLCLGSSA